MVGDNRSDEEKAAGLALQYAEARTALDQRSYSFIVSLEGDMVQYGPDIRRFMDAMVYKLSKNAHKGRWASYDTDHTMGLLGDEVIELVDALKSRNMVEVMLEAADVANFALIIAAIAMERGVK